MYRPLLLVLFVALLATACGSSSPDRDQALLDAMVDDILGEDDEEAVTTDPDEATCIAEKTYDAFGKERLDELGVTAGSGDPTDGDITDAEAEDVWDALTDCTDIQQSFADSFVGGPIDQGAADCIASEIGEDGLKKLFLDGIGAEEPGDDFFETLTSAADACDVNLFG